jgi:hypothetical protein
MLLQGKNVAIHGGGRPPKLRKRSIACAANPVRTKSGFVVLRGVRFGEIIQHQAGVS